MSPSCVVVPGLLSPQILRCFEIIDGVCHGSAHSLCRRILASKPRSLRLRRWAARGSQPYPRLLTLHVVRKVLDKLANCRLVRCSDGQFDPQIVEALLSLPQPTWADLRDARSKPTRLFIVGVSSVGRYYMFLVALALSRTSYSQMSAIAPQRGNDRVRKAWIAVEPAFHPSHTLWKFLRDYNIPTASTTRSGI